MQLDLKDRKILQALILNCRTPINLIARIVNLRIESVKERIKKLEGEGIIKFYYVTTYRSAVGLIRFVDFFLKTKPLKSEVLEEISEIPEVVRLSTFYGAYTLGITLTCSKEEHVKEVMNRIEGLLCGSLEFYATLPVHMSTYLRRLYFINRKDEEDFSNFNIPFQRELKSVRKPPVGILKLDKLDLKILEILSTRANGSLRNIALKLKTSPNIVKSRISNLIKKGVIWHFTTLINYEKLEHTQYQLLINFNGEKELVDKFKKFLMSQEKAHSYYEYANLWDAKIVFIVKNNHEMKKILEQITEKYGELIKDYTLLEVQKQVKYSSYPENLPQQYERAKLLFLDNLN